MKKLNELDMRIRINPSGFFHDTREDVRRIAVALQHIVDKQNEIIDKINQIIEVMNSEEEK